MIKVPTKSTDNRFLIVSILIFLTGIYNVVYKFELSDSGIVAATNLWNPAWLLFGPLLYFANKFIQSAAATFKPVYLLHFVPFALFTIFYLVALTEADAKNPWVTQSFVHYQNSFFIISLSLIPYSIACLLKFAKSDKRTSRQEELLIGTLSASYLMVSLTVVLMFMAWGVVHIDMGIDYRYFSYGLLVVTNLVIIWYWISPKENGRRLNEGLDNEASYTHSALTAAQITQYKENIVNYFNTTDSYLAPSLSLNLLSKELAIPKHHLSQLFNVHLATSFHGFVAKYRIQYALQLMDESKGKLKIESLAHACGFNSKTSFNRYFKELTGLAPSVYQLQLEEDANRTTNENQ